MPWHIILVFLVLGILIGINASKNEASKQHNTKKA